MEVTDMILDIGQLDTNGTLPAVALRLQTPETKAEILRFVATEHAWFLRYYESPRTGTDVCAVVCEGQMVGSVLIEKEPKAAVTLTDGAIACLVTAEVLRGQGIGSALSSPAAPNFGSRDSGVLLRNGLPASNSTAVSAFVYGRLGRLA